jgi:hypothetical protein
MGVRITFNTYMVYYSNATIRLLLVLVLHLPFLPIQSTGKLSARSSYFIVSFRDTVTHGKHGITPSCYVGSG